MKSRRLRRRLKAAASIVVALAAGTFLACAKDPEDAPAAGPSNASPDGSKPTAAAEGTANQDAPSANPDGGAATEPSATPSATTSSSATPSPSASTTALAPRKPPPKPWRKVDKKEHRKGMPVLDNLVE